MTIVKLIYSLTDTSSKDDIIIRGGNTPIFFNLTSNTMARYIASYCNEEYMTLFLFLFAKKAWDHVDSCYNIEHPTETDHGLGRVLKK